jgi:cell division protein FtsZ
LFNITGGRTLGLHELNAAANVIAGVVDRDAEIIFGTAVDPKVGDEVKITLIATGFPRLHAVSPVPEEYRRAVGDDGMQPRAESPRYDEALPARGVADADDKELPTFLRRTVPTR